MNKPASRVVYASDAGRLVSKCLRSHAVRENACAVSHRRNGPPVFAEQMAEVSRSTRRSHRTGASAHQTMARQVRCPSREQAAYLVYTPEVAVAEVLQPVADFRLKLEVIQAPYVAAHGWQESLRVLTLSARATGLICFANSPRVAA